MKDDESDREASKREKTGLPTPLSVAEKSSPEGSVFTRLAMTKTAAQKAREKEAEISRAEAKTTKRKQRAETPSTSTLSRTPRQDPYTPKANMSARRTEPHFVVAGPSRLRSSMGFRSAARASARSTDEADSACVTPESPVIVLNKPRPKSVTFGELSSRVNNVSEIFDLSMRAKAADGTQMESGGDETYLGKGKGNVRTDSVAAVVAEPGFKSSVVDSQTTDDDDDDDDDDERSVWAEQLEASLRRRMAMVTEESSVSCLASNVSIPETGVTDPSRNPGVVPISREIPTEEEYQAMVDKAQFDMEEAAQKASRIRSRRNSSLMQHMKDAFRTIKNIPAIRSVGSSHKVDVTNTFSPHPEPGESTDIPNDAVLSALDVRNDRLALINGRVRTLNLRNVFKRRTAQPSVRSSPEPHVEEGDEEVWAFSAPGSVRGSQIYELSATDREGNIRRKSADTIRCWNDGGAFWLSAYRARRLLGEQVPTRGRRRCC